MGGAGLRGAYTEGRCAGVVDAAGLAGGEMSEDPLDDLASSLRERHFRGVSMHAMTRSVPPHTPCGASNLSFGLPNRNGINSTFLSMAITACMTSAITNPLHGDIVQACLAADVMMGHDPDCRQWIARYREPPMPGSEGERGRRTSGRRRRG